MLPEALVLDRNHRIHKVRGDLLKAHPLPVGALHHKRRDRISLPVIGLRRVGGGAHIDLVDIRGGIQNPTEHAKPEGEDEKNGPDRKDQGRAPEKSRDPVPDPGLRAVQLIERIFYVIAGVLHPVAFSGLKPAQKEQTSLWSFLHNTIVRRFFSI